MNRQEKLRRLEATKRRVPALSASALAGLLQDIEANGLPGLSGRKHVKEATVKSLDMNSYGNLIQVLNIPGKGKKNIPVVYANFFTLLQGFFLQREPFRDLLISAMQGTAARALSLCFYADEINPGNSLAVEQNRNLHIICMFCLCFVSNFTRKMLLTLKLTENHTTGKIWCIYFSFLEFGPVILAREQAWLPVCCQRSTLVSALPGGVSQLAACILEDIFNSNRAEPEILGIQLQGPAKELYKLRFTLGAFLQDGQAHKLLFSVKGDSGTRCCILCQNVVSHGSNLEDAVLTSLASAEEELILTSDADFERSVQTLLRKHTELNKGDFALWQQACGITYNPAALIFQPSLQRLVKPISQWLHDWMHCFFQKGIWLLGLTTHLPS